MRVESRVGAPAGTTWAQVGDRLVVATPVASRPIVLDPVSSTVWPMLLDGTPISEVCAALAAGPDDAAAVEQFVTELVDQLCDAGFLAPADEDREAPVRRFHATCSPCDTAPLLKGQTSTTELQVDGVGVTVLVLDRTRAAERLADVAVPDAADPQDLFVIGRVPFRGTPALFDHHGVVMAESDWDHIGELADLLVDDLRRQRHAELTLRGVAVPTADGVVVVHERWRTLARQAAADGLTGDPSPSSLFAAGLRDGGARVEVRSADAPYELEWAPLVALGIPEAPVDGAAALASAATLLRDPCDLAAAARLCDGVEMSAVPTDGVARTFAEWIDRAGAAR